METDGPSTSASLSQKENYDIYLLASSNKTPYFRKMMNIIHNNRWSVQTPFDHEPGVLLYEIVTDAISHCSHVLCIITKEDCDDVSFNFVFDVAMSTMTDRGLGERVIPIYCCDLSSIPLKLKCVAGASIHDEDLERRLQDVIGIRTVTGTISGDQLTGKVPCNRSRIMVVGPAGVGKTSFINRLTNQKFNQEEESTVGTVSTHTTSQWKLEKGPRDELAECLARRKNSSTEERTAVASNSDLPLPTTERGHSSFSETEGNERLQEYAKGLQVERIYSVTSSANDIIYSIWDFGGQEIYYITHPLFLSWRSLYIAVFPLHKLMTENALREEGQMEGGPTRTYRTMLDLMHFWMMSIYVHAVPPNNMKDPKILLVGTFCNDDQSKSNRDTNISKLLDMVTDKPYSNQVILSVVEIDNRFSSDDEISQIQRKIDDLIKDADYMKEELPIKWRIFLDKTKDLRQDTLKLTEAREIMKEMGIRDDKEVQDVLRFCHDAGHLIYHEGCELIILHPEVLNSFVSNIITVITPEKLHGELGEHWDRLQKKGVLSMDLIKAVWKQHKEKDELDMVIDMMIKFDLVCEIHDTQGEYQGRHFFVPCRSSPTLHLEEQHGSDDEFQFIINFKHLLPDGFLHRLYVSMAKWAMDQGGPKNPSFHCREMLFYIDERHRVIMSNDIEGGDAHKIKVTIYAISVDDHPDPNAKVNFRCHFMKDLDDTLEKLKETWARRITYAVGIECPKCNKIVPLAKFKSYKERVPCDNCCSSILVSKVPQCIRRSSVDASTTGTSGLLDVRRRTVESAKRSVPPRQPSNSSAGALYQRQQPFYDIYLVYSQETDNVGKVKDIIRSNGWTMTTPADRRLGMSKIASVEEALKTCSHVIMVITKEDCDVNDPHLTMTIEMALQSSGRSFDCQVIPIRCCDKEHLPEMLKNLTGTCITDANLEDQLKSINVSITKRREESTSVGSASYTTDTDGYEIIRLEQHKIEVKVPRNEKWGAKDIKVQALTEVPPELMELLKKVEAVAISFGLEMKPSDAEFRTPIEVTMPHSAIFEVLPTDPSSFAMYYRGKGADSFALIPFTCDDRRCVVRKKDLTLYVDHFSERWIVAFIRMILWGSRPVTLTPYFPKRIERGNSQQVLYLCVRDGGQTNDVELEGQYAKLPSRSYPTNMKSGDLEIRCKASGNEVDEVQTLPVTRYQHLFNAEVHFKFHTESVPQETKEILIEFFLRQECDERDCLKILCSFKDRDSHRQTSGEMSTLDSHRQSSGEMDIAAAASPDLTASSSSHDPVTDDMLENLSSHVSHEEYTSFCGKLGIGYDEATTYLDTVNKSYKKAVRHFLNQWKNKTSRSIADLEIILCAAELGDLKKHLKSTRT